MRRNGRILLGVGLLGLGAWSVGPGLVHPSSTDAVVNAEVVTVRAPLNGFLADGLGVAVGDRLTSGQTVARVRALRPETQRRDGLALELAAQKQLLASLAAEEAELARLDHELAKRSAAYRSASTERLSHARTESEARLQAAEARLARARAEQERKETLFAKDLLAPAAVESARAAAREATADRDEARAERARLAAEARAVARGAMVGGGGDDTPYSGQRRDEVRVKRAGRKVELAQAQVRVTELERQVAAEAAQAGSLAELGAPVSGVVWSRFATEGDAVRAGDPVLGMVDCNKLFLTAVLPKRFFPELKAGDRARARLAGTDEAVVAVVESVRAAGGSQANGTAAVTPAAEQGRDVVVTLSLRDAHIGSRSDNLCQVGQHAMVTFQVPALKPLVDAVASGVLGGGNAS
ncbi:MAG TPA: HlyD family efflux transporter periplasmic adaptor subunit [Magnetospirillum sp.]|jgi:biotin carboxyl carrier protein|nr:HlyD family efflux transporter periplasmic adaptor subunit [Magnetospirillum sp.]